MSVNYSVNQPGAYQPPFYLRRPLTPDDLRRLQENQKRHRSGTHLYRPFLLSRMKSSSSPSDSAVPPHPISPWIGQGRLLNPVARNWCFLYLEDRYRNIVGVIFIAGLTDAARARCLREDGDEIPMDDFDWRDFHVPDPARQDLTYNAFTCPLINWNDPDCASAFIEISNKMSDLFHLETLFTQVVHPSDDADPGTDHSWASLALGFRRIRACRSKTEEKAPVSVWAWERGSAKSALFRPNRSELDAAYSQIAALAKFYQSLTQAVREELIFIANGFSAQAAADRTGRKVKTAQSRRDRLGDLVPWNDEAMLNAMGIETERGSRDLASLFRQPRVAQALNRIAWFYCELPDGL